MTVRGFTEETGFQGENLRRFPYFMAAIISVSKT